jgi:hypothetical protein
MVQSLLLLVLSADWMDMKAFVAFGRRVGPAGWAHMIRSEKRLLAERSKASRESSGEREGCSALVCSLKESPARQRDYLDKAACAREKGQSREEKAFRLALGDVPDETRDGNGDCRCVGGR